MQAYEEGEYSPTFDKAVKLAKLYGCELHDFIDQEDNEKWLYIVL